MKQPQHSLYRFLVAAMGPGEIGQGMAFAQYALRQGATVIFSVPNRNYLPLIKIPHPKFSFFVAKNSIALKKAILIKKIDVLILCNSKIFTRNDDFYKNPPEPKPPTLSIDSNWLFGPSSPYISIPWVDKYCLNLPKPIFQLGLKKNGGHYQIPEKILKKINVVGLIPSYNPLPDREKSRIRKHYGIHKDEKLIFLYTSIGYLTKPAVFLRAYQIVKKLREEGEKIKMIYFGDNPSIPLNTKDHQWFLLFKRTSSEYFSKVLASSDLVFQHQGLATLEQAIGAQIPVIANVKDAKDEKNPTHHRHAWEVGPFARYGACAMFFFHDSISVVMNMTEDLLFNRRRIKKMISRQRMLYTEGEVDVYNEAIKLLKNNF